MIAPPLSKAIYFSSDEAEEVSPNINPITMPINNNIKAVDINIFGFCIFANMKYLPHSSLDYVGFG